MQIVATNMNKSYINLHQTLKFGAFMNTEI